MALLGTLAQLFPEHAPFIAEQGVAGAPGVAALMPQAPAAPSSSRSGGFLSRLFQPEALDTIGATLKDVSAGLQGQDGVALDKLAAKKKAAADQRQYAAWVNGLDLDPSMKFLALTNPEQFAKVYGQQHEFKTGVDGGVAWHQGPDGQVHWDTQRQQNYSEAETGRHNLAEENRPIPTAPGGALVTPTGQALYQSPYAPMNVAPGGTIVAPGMPGGAPGAPPLAAGFDSIYDGFTAPHEGGYTPSDGNGAPANFGINQKANPDVDVRGLDAQGARKIMHDRYWVPSGADQISDPALQAIQFDTAVNFGPGVAQQLLQQSGGDPTKYLSLREQKFRAIAAADPSKAKSLPVWLKRNEDLGAYVGGNRGRGGQGGGVIYSNPKEQVRPATAEEKRAYGLPEDLPAKMGPNGIEVISGVGANNKHPPPAISGGYTANRATIAQIDKTIAAIKANPGALGLRNKLGDDVMQRLDPGGQGVRSMVAATGATKRHEVSGAAVTFSEKPDLMPFIPSVSDTPDAAIAKLEKMKDNLVQANVEIETTYSPENGYAPISADQGQSPTPQRASGGQRSIPSQPPIPGARRSRDGWNVEDPTKKGSFPVIQYDDKGPYIEASDGTKKRWQ